MKYLMFFIVLILLFTDNSHAATIQLPKTGQTNCYPDIFSGVVGSVPISCTGTGQDGEIQAGVAWPNPRFVDNSLSNSANQTMTDNLTSLMWTKDANLMKTRDPLFDADNTAQDGRVTWQHALDYVKKLNTENYLGHSDWRLPNINELTSLVTRGSVDHPYNWLIGQGFINVLADNYWSSTSAYYKEFAWIINTNNGDVGINAKAYVISGSTYVFLPVWPVRSDSSGAVTLPITGQTTCYDKKGVIINCSGTGQDGELQAGVAWPSPRFIDNSLDNNTDQTMTDKLTGLIWTKDANLMKSRDPTFLPSGSTYQSSGELLVWHGALEYVKKLNTESYLSHSDWRLPNINELSSIVNRELINSNTWLNGLGFTNVQAKNYWSSNFANFFHYAWVVMVSSGKVDFDDYQMGGGWVWPVRGGVTGSLLNGKCGSANATTVTIAPTTNLCTTGTTSIVTGSGPWEWSCNGINGGTNATCIANIQTYAVIFGFIGNGGGSVSGDMSCTKGANCPILYFSANKPIVLIPTPDINSIFNGWSGDCTNASGNCELTMNSTKNITCTFTEADKVRIDLTPYVNLSSAFLAATSGQVFARAIEFKETLNVSASTNFKGGFNSDYSNNMGNFTFLSGTLIVGSGGSLIVEGLKIR